MHMYHTYVSTTYQGTSPYVLAADQASPYSLPPLGWTTDTAIAIAASSSIGSIFYRQQQFHLQGLIIYLQTCLDFSCTFQRCQIGSDVRLFCDCKCQNR